MRTSLHHTLALIFIYNISEAISQILRSPYKKDEESTTDCDVLQRHLRNIPYWEWADSLNLTHVLTPLKFSIVGNVETTLYGLACSKQMNNKLNSQNTLQC
jgi:hypothetical protein